jgi:VWFA-related protein
MVGPRRSRWVVSVAALALAVGSGLAPSGRGAAAPQTASAAVQAAVQPAPAQPVPKPTFRSGRDLVVVNVVVRDRQGRLVRGLTRDDFAVFEDNRPQVISTFDFEDLEQAVPASGATEPMAVLAPALKPPTSAATPPAPLESRPLPNLRDKRLIVLFFDVSSMQPEDVARAVDSAREYVTKRLAPPDTLAVVTLGTSLEVLQDFTSDRDALLAALDRLSPVEGTGFEAAAGNPEELPDEAFVPDESEFLIFNIDRRLDALRRLADVLGGIEQKKSVIYFSSGLSTSGLDNQAALRAVVDRAVRANVSLYAADTRGLQAIVPGGEAGRASARGVGAFSGRAMMNARDQFAAAQDALTTLAEDTGGKAFFDVNEFGEVFTQVVQDTTAYYLIGYSSTNPARDGRYRRIRVTLTRPDLKDAKLEYRPGYFAPRDFAHAGRDDRELQLQEFLLSDLPPTDLPVHAAAGYFRIGEHRYFVPLWIIVPGSEVPFATTATRERATLDVFGVVRNARQQPVAWIRDTVRLDVAAAQNVRRKNVQYETSFELPPGVYRLKLVIRENQDGTVGSLDTTLVVPDVTQQAPRLSSVVLSTQRVPARRRRPSPLTRGGDELVANVARVVQTKQPLTFYYEVYDPARPASAGGPAGPPRVLSSVACYRGSRRVYQSELVEARQLTAQDRGAVSFEVSLPPGTLSRGLYTCQVTVIDDVAGTFAFPRVTLYVTSN